MPVYRSLNDDRPDSVPLRPYGSAALDILCFGPIALYCSRKVLEEDVEELRTEGFEVHRLDCESWDDQFDAVEQILAAVGAPPSDEPRNMNYLEEELDEVALGPTDGVVLVLDKFHRLRSRAWTRDRQALLGMLAASSRRQQLHGRSLLTFVQSDEPGLTFDPVGACRPGWNQREFVDTDRRPDGS